MKGNPVDCPRPAVDDGRHVPCLYYRAGSPAARVIRTSTIQLQGYNMDKNNDLNDRGAGNRIKGTAKEVAGKVRGDVGDALDSGDDHLKGRAKEAEGKVQKNVGKAEQALGEKLDRHQSGYTEDQSKKR
jgi:uncharacterized protein YjbJ (UPF0337 family)